MAKVSVLMAVYNAEQWLNESLDSLIAQTEHDIQIVCVDDASTDHSLQILNDYAERDTRVEVVHLDTNVGMAKARNIALQRAHGEFVCMLDADDWYDHNAFQEALAVFECYPLTDVVLFHFTLVYPDRVEDFNSEPFDVLSGKDACIKSLTWQIHGIYMVRATIHKRYPYDETCRLYSDENTTRVHYAVSKEVRCCSGVYYYRQHDNSMTHHRTILFFDKLRSKESLIRQMKSLGINVTSVTNMLWHDVIDCYMFYHVHGGQLSADERRYGLSELHRVWDTIDCSMLNKKTTAKFGYRPCRWWWLFRLQEWLYFTLRGLLGKNY